MWPFPLSFSMTLLNAGRGMGRLNAAMALKIQMSKKQNSQEYTSSVISDVLCFIHVLLLPIGMMLNTYNEM